MKYCEACLIHPEVAHVNMTIAASIESMLARAALEEPRA